MHRWCRLASLTVVESKWLRLTADRCEGAAGRIIDPFYVVHEPEWAVIVATNAQGEILTVRQYRYPADHFCTELPGGIVDANEALEDAAKRELLEETGHVADRWAYAGRLFANPARQTNSVHIFVAQDLDLVAGQKLDADEELTWEYNSPQRIEAAIAGNEFSHAIHVAAFYRGMHWLSTRRPA